MQLSSENRQFVEKYNNVVDYHLECILKSRLILDEDLQLVMTFWNPTLLRSKPSWDPFLLTSAGCATVGMLSSLKFHSVYPLAASFLSVLIPTIRRAKHLYTSRKYTNNFEKLMNKIAELYDVNRKIIDYFNKWNVQERNATVELTRLLLESREEFLRLLILKLLNLLEALKKNISSIFRLVPITESEYMYSVHWNLNEFENVALEFKSLKVNFQKLIDFYVLLISSFLSCVALSMCIQLWKNPACRFQEIFNKVIPNVLEVIDNTLNETKRQFNLIRFRLSDTTDEVIKKQRKIKSDFSPIQSSLDDFLINTQITFETARQIQILLERKVKLESFSRDVEQLNRQFEVSQDLLNSLSKMFYLLTKPKINEVRIEQPGSVETSNVGLNIRYDDFVNNVLGDEEWNLSIHGSGSEDEPPVFNEFADHMSTEHLELMLHELKRKLKERKAGTGANEDDSNVPLPPIPPPRPSLNKFSMPLQIPELPTVDNTQRNFLEEVRSVAQKLNREEEFHFGFNMYPEIPRPFNATYSCYSVAMLPGNERVDVERGGKIIMPTSALEQLTRLNINYPMLFKITNKKTNRITHCGVLEFVADEGKAYLPLWMMHNLVLEEGNAIQVESVSLSVGNFAKFQPLSPEFLDITNPKAVLENCLRTFACLTTGDVIAVTYNQKVYELCVLETKPGDAISIIECDMNVDFAPPVGYKEHEPKKQEDEQMVVDPADLMPATSAFVAFRGCGNRLDGKPRKDSGSVDAGSSKPVYVRGIPDYDYVIGTLTFQRHAIKNTEDNKDDANNEFKAFSGEGFKLRVN